MVAIAAAAFALDAFYASVIEQAPIIKVAAKSRDASIFETLKRAFLLRPEQRTALREQLRLIFRLRDQAVHAASTARSTASASSSETACTWLSRARWP